MKYWVWMLLLIVQSDAIAKATYPSIIKKVNKDGSYSVIYLKTPKLTGEANSLSNVITSDNLKDLETRSEMIAELTPLQDFEHSRHFAEYSVDHFINSWATYRQVKISKVLKGDKRFVGKVIEINEPAGIIEQLDGTMGKFSSGDYKVMDKGVTYVMFLGTNNDGQYGIINRNNGKFPVTENLATMRSSQPARIDSVNQSLRSELKLKGWVKN